MRYAIYFTPGPTDPLTRAASAWLGRDAFSGDALDREHAGPLDDATVSAITAAPRRYGFHATLKAPFRLASDRSESDLVEALRTFAARATPVTVPDMTLGNIDGFFALVTVTSNSALNIFAARAVEAFEPYRAPLTEADIARRNPGQLAPHHLDNLRKWGYPYVFDEFKFHMTLTNRIPEGNREKVASALDRTVLPALDNPFTLDSIALFVEPAPGAPFLVHTHLPLGTPATEKPVHDAQ